MKSTIEIYLVSNPDVAVQCATAVIAEAKMDNMYRHILAVFCIFYLISAISGLYFHIGETEKKCFIEEIPDETMVVGAYCN